MKQEGRKTCVAIQFIAGYSLGKRRIKYSGCVENLTEKLIDGRNGGYIMWMMMVEGITIG